MYIHDSEARDTFVSAFKEGHIISNENDYWSSTISKEGHNPGANNVRLFIKSETGKDFRKYNPDEGEILFMRGCKFLVEKVDDRDWRRVKIYLKELNDG